MTAPATIAPATPATVQAAVREAAAAGRTLRIAGAGRWLDAGRPVAADERLDLGRLAGIVEYVPGDLTMTALAGTTLGELREAAAAEGQWLPLDPWGDDRGTLGATLATATAGPLSGALGLVRDVVLGVAFVTGTGELVHGGGRVVKNVAGFDLVRLTVGAWGTLGVITEATVRLRALPEVDATLALPVPTEEPALAALLGRLRALPVLPTALELVDGPLAAAVGLGDGSALLVRIAGNDPAVRAQRAALDTLADAREVPAGVWDRLRAAEPAATAVLRLSARPSRVAACWAEARGIARALGGTVCASVARGVARVAVPADDHDALLEALTPAAGGATRIFERLPAALWPELAPGTAADRLSPLVKRAFDPDHVLNPGIMGLHTDSRTDAHVAEGAPDAAAVGSLRGAAR